MEQQVPSAIAGSMGKEKKPFTYLPGGLDFSEIRSPKMAKRLAKHQANMAKVGSSQNQEDHFFCYVLAQLACSHTSYL